jgi:hypothetical protein
VEGVVIINPAEYDYRDIYTRTADRFNMARPDTGEIK